ncbi:MAG TPA: hypothetical protein GXZ60_04615 [Intrasporangiaceae bacterium]|nr:hypothetical protein [Intrasporangiaceae bacterium]
MSDDQVPAGATRIGGFDSGGRWFVLGLFGIGGAALGFIFPFLTRWAAELPWMPFQGPLRLLGSFDHGWLTWGRPLIGLLLGMVLASFVIHSSAVLTMTDEQIEVRSAETVTLIRRDQVDGVRRVGGKLVIVNATGRELLNAEVEGTKDEQRDAFVKHGYPWESGA